MVRAASRALGFAFTLLLLASPALAGSDTASGTLVPGGPTIDPVAIISTPNCTGAVVAFAALYGLEPLSVGASGTYHVDEPGTESAVYILQGSFDPAAVVDTCIAASNTNPIAFDVALSAGVQYYAVVIEDTFTQDGMDYTLTVSGPGEVSLGFASLVEIPTLSTWGVGALVLLLAGVAFLALRRHARA